MATQRTAYSSLHWAISSTSDNDKEVRGQKSEKANNGRFAGQIHAFALFLFIFFSTIS